MRIKRFIANLICGLIPSKKARHDMRKFITKPHPRILPQFHNERAARYDWPGPLVCTSQLCNYDFFELPLYQFWAREINEAPKLHRKQWEFVYIAQALWENGMLAKGKKGLGFACGQEPLPALFAKYGVEVLATDLDMNDAHANGWLATGQNAGNNIMSLNQAGICSEKNFRRLVRFQTMNMNDIPRDLDGQFDFNWSACSVEHIGGLEKSMRFLIDNLRTLKSGGIAIHTSEFNLSSETKTCLAPDSIIFRKHDIEEIIAETGA